MTPALRTAILDALMERWRRRVGQHLLNPGECSKHLALHQEFVASYLDLILPVAEPMIREAALREAADVAKAVAEAASASIVADQSNWFTRGELTAANAIQLDILALGEPK